MAELVFEEPYSMFSVTPLENVFIEEYMFRAPGDFVKVYIYALKSCYHGGDFNEEKCGKTLGMSSEAVGNAIAYWKRMSVIDVSEDDGRRIQFINLAHQLLTRDKMRDDLYRYRRFNQDAQLLFGTRLLTSSEFQVLYDLMEHLGFDEHAVLKLTEYCISKRGNNVRLAYIKKAGEGIFEDGIRTGVELERYLTDKGVITKLLKHLGLNRSATQDERELYAKFTIEWGFTDEAVIAACRDMTGAGNPSLKYLEQILSGYMRRGILSADAIAGEQRRREDSAPVREVLYEAGIRRKVTPALYEQYLKWTEDWGFEHEAVLILARQIRRRGKSIDELEAELERFRTMELLRADELKDHYEALAASARGLMDIYREAGEDGAVDSGAIARYAQWTREWGFTPEMLLLAARESQSAKHKLAYINRVLSQWHKEGINTPEAAEKLKLSGGAKQDKKAGYGFGNERAYTDEELEDVFTQL